MGDFFHVGCRRCHPKWHFVSFLSYNKRCHPGTLHVMHLASTKPTLNIYLMTIGVYLLDNVVFFS